MVWGCGPDPEVKDTRWALGQQWSGAQENSSYHPQQALATVPLSTVFEHKMSHGNHILYSLTHSFNSLDRYLWSVHNRTQNWARLWAPGVLDRCSSGLMHSELVRLQIFAQLKTVGSAMR